MPFSLNTKITTLIGIFTIVGMSYAGFAVIDNRYAHAGELKQLEKKIDANRISDLEDKIFSLQFKIQSGEGTALDAALLERYQNQMNVLTK